MQFHYVGLDKIPEPALLIADKPVLSDQPKQPDSDNELDDATIAEGDEHGVVPHKMMYVENPESFRHTMCVAQAEGEKPLNIMTDLNFEAMSNLDKFPWYILQQATKKAENISIKGYWTLMADLLEILIICLLHSILLKLSK